MYICKSYLYTGFLLRSQVSIEFGPFSDTSARNSPTEISADFKLSPLTNRHVLTDLIELQSKSSTVVIVVYLSPALSHPNCKYKLHHPVISTKKLQPQ